MDASSSNGACGVVFKPSFFSGVYMFLVNGAQTIIQSVLPLSAPTPPTVERGPFDRVQNTAKIVEYLSKGGNEWVFSSKEGPFRALGQERIKQIKSSSAGNVVERLNGALFGLNYTIYSTIENWIKGDVEQFPDLPACEYVDFNGLLDCCGEPLISKAISESLFRPKKLEKLGHLIDLGIKIDHPILQSLSNTMSLVPPLTAAWAQAPYDIRKTENILQVADYLLEKGANIHQAVDDTGNNLLGLLGLEFFAEKNLLDWYLKKNGDINFQNGKGDTFFHLLAPLDLSGSDHMQSATKLIEAGSNLTLANHAGEHAIHAFCKNGCHREVFELIIKNAPQELYAKDGEGYSTLYLCSAFAHLDFLKIVIQHWQQAKALNMPSTPAELNTPEELIKSLVFATSSPLFNYSAAAQQRDLENTFLPILELLLPYLGNSPEEIRNLFIQKREGETALHLFAHSSPWLPQRLVDNKIINSEDLEIKNHQGQTVQSIANEMKQSLILFDACSEIDAAAILQLLSEFKTKKKLPIPAKILFEVLVSEISDDLRHPLPISAKLELLNAWLDFERDPNGHLENGQTPLYFTLNRCKADYVFSLLDHGANPFLNNRDGKSSFTLLNDQLANLPPWSEEREQYILLKKAMEGAISST